MKKAVREPIATWWKIGQYKPTIEPLHVVAFTGSFVTYLEKEWRLSGPDVFRERRERRDDIFPTFSDAKQEMVNRATKGVERAKEELQRRRSFLGNVESLKDNLGTILDTVAPTPSIYTVTPQGDSQ